MLGFYLFVSGHLLSVYIISDDNGNLEVCLEKIKRELEACRSSIALENAKSKVIPELYKDTGLTSTGCTSFKAD